MSDALISFFVRLFVRILQPKVRKFACMPNGCLAMLPHVAHTCLYTFADPCNVADDLLLLYVLSLCYGRRVDDQNAGLALF